MIFDYLCLLVRYHSFDEVKLKESVSDERNESLALVIYTAHDTTHTHTYTDHTHNRFASRMLYGMYRIHTSEVRGFRSLFFLRGRPRGSLT